MSSKDENDWADAKSPFATKKITSIFDFSSEALGELKLWMESAGLSLPSVIRAQSTANAASVTRSAFTATTELTSSTSYTNLATTGPELTDVTAGNYVLIWGATCLSPAAQVSSMAVAEDGTVITHAAETQVTTNTSISSSGLYTITGTTLTAKYKISGGANGSWSNRWLVAIKIG